MLLFSDEDVPAVLPAQGLQLSDRQRGLPVGHRAERAIDQVNRREPGYDEGTEHALEKQGSGGGGERERAGKSNQDWPHTSTGGPTQSRSPLKATAGSLAACPAAAHQGDSPQKRTRRFSCLAIKMKYLQRCSLRCCNTTGIRRIWNVRAGR